MINTTGELTQLLWLHLLAMLIDAAITRAILLNCRIYYLMIAEQLTIPNRVKINTNATHNKHCLGI